jgi:limonene-1,2-epoxide hydrolase
MGMRISQVMNKALKSDGTEAEEQPQIDCHPPTGIFIVKGRESQVRIVSDIIAALGGEAVQAESDSRTPQQSPTKADDQSKVTLQYIGAEEAVRAVIDALGGKSASAVLRIEPQTNTVEINTASEAAMRVKVLLEQLDQRPQSHQIESIIKKGAAQDQQIVARPTVLTMGSQPAVISLGEGKDRVEIELTVKPGPLGDGWIAKTARDLEHARENLQKLKKQSQQTVKQVQSALLDHEAVSINATKPMPPVMPANCRTSCVECHAQAPVFAPKR